MNAVVETQERFDTLPLNPAEVRVMWDPLFLIIQGSGLYRDTAVAQMLLDCMAGRLQAWIMRRTGPDTAKTLDGVILTEIRWFPYQDAKVLQVVHLNTLNRSFSRDKWVFVYKALHRYAKREGCTKARLFTEHPGLQEIIAELGFRPIGLFEKEI